MAEVKMKDIAAAVGVSVVTVSNALSGRKGVSEDVRQLVEKTARDMGYNQKKPEKPSQSGVIGVIASEKYITVGNSFYWAMTRMWFMKRQSSKASLCWRLSPLRQRKKRSFRS